jgi:proteasome lid subunit RPN8/RPN11
VTRRAVTIPSTIRVALVAEARRHGPRECCGLLVGRGRNVAFAVRMKNVEEDESRFRVDEAAHIELRRVLRSAFPPLAIVGVYHSHPRGDAMLSDTDVREAYYPEWVHLVVGLARRGADVRAFEVRGGRARPVRIRWRARASR